MISLRPLGRWLANWRNLLGIAAILLALVAGYALVSVVRSNAVLRKAQAADVQRLDARAKIDAQRTAIDAQIATTSQANTKVTLAHFDELQGDIAALIAQGLANVTRVVQLTQEVADLRAQLAAHGITPVYVTTTTPAPTPVYMTTTPAPVYSYSPPTTAAPTPAPATTTSPAHGKKK